MIEYLEEELKKLGFKVEGEHYVKIGSQGFKPVRYGDLWVRTPEGERWIIQVGWTTKGGAPVAREVKAIKDLESKGWKVEFIGLGPIK